VADGDQADIGWFRLAQPGDGVANYRVQWRGLVIIPLRRQNACLFARGREDRGLAAEIGADNGDLVSSAGLRLRQRHVPFRALDHSTVIQYPPQRLTEHTYPRRAPATHKLCVAMDICDA
jgi:hypothetical protein